MADIANNALTTLADVKESLGIPSGNTSKDNLIIRKINQASLVISNYCERIFQRADYTELLSGSQTDEFTLAQRPVNDFTSLEYRNSNENLNDFITINSNYYFYDSSAGVLKLNFGAAGRWDRWRATYNAGYDTIPADLAEACASLAAFYVNNPDGSNIGVLLKQEGQRSVRYANTAQSFKSVLSNLGIDQIIDGYANWPLKGV